ncbi:MAG: hypothetical protein AB1450_13370 [Pseudomonadota bacterium]
MAAHKTLLQQMRRVEAWNDAHPIGVAVKVRAESGNFKTTTVSAAQILGDHTAVIYVEALSGCVPLDRVRALQGEPS